MDSAEAIKELEYIKIKLKEANVFVSPSMDIAMNMAKEALQFQDIMVNNPKSAKPTPEVCKTCMDNKQDDWTPVSDDTLPDEGVDVNVTLKDFAETRTGFLNEEGWWLITKEGVLESYPLGYVIAWQPLPEPYKGGDTE